jgi:hypothetical protein
MLTNPRISVDAPAFAAMLLMAAAQAAWKDTSSVPGTTVLMFITTMRVHPYAMKSMGRCWRRDCCGARGGDVAAFRAGMNNRRTDPFQRSVKPLSLRA